MTDCLPVLQTLASDLIGDGKGPNWFFVCDGSVVVMVTSDFDAAYRHWESLKERLPLQESTLEDRQWGVICGVLHDDDDPIGRMSILDDELAWRRRRVRS